MKKSDNDLVSRAPKSSPKTYNANSVQITINGQPIKGFTTGAPVSVGYNMSAKASVNCPKCGNPWFWVTGNQPHNITCTCGNMFVVAHAIAAQTATSSPTYNLSQLRQRRGISHYTECPHCRSTLHKTGVVLAPKVEEWECSGLMNQAGMRHIIVVYDDETP